MRRSPSSRRSGPTTAFAAGSTSRRRRELELEWCAPRSAGPQDLLLSPRALRRRPVPSLFALVVVRGQRSTPDEEPRRPRDGSSRSRRGLRRGADFAPDVPFTGRWVSPRSVERRTPRLSFARLLQNIIEDGKKELGRARSIRSRGSVENSPCLDHAGCRYTLTERERDGEVHEVVALLEDVPTKHFETGRPLMLRRVRSAP